AVKAAEDDMVCQAGGVEFSTLVLNDRSDAKITQAIRLIEAREPAPGDLSRAGSGSQPEVPVTIFDLRRDRLIVHAKHCGIAAKASLVELGEHAVCAEPDLSV